MTNTDQTSVSLAREAADALDQRRGCVREVRALVGFDGFVDTIVRAVAKRTDGGVEPFARMGEFAARIAEAAGRSANIELDVRRVKLGGNGPIMAGALLALGARTTYVGPLDDPDSHEGEPARLHAVFRGFADECERCVSIGAAGRTDAIEFDDGKLMLGKLSSLDEIDWAAVVRALGGENDAADSVRGASLIAATNWTMLPGMGSIWRGLAGCLDGEPRDAHSFFIDLADPAKRPDEDVSGAMDTLREMDLRAPVTLGVNAAEGDRLAHLAGIATTGCADAPAPGMLEESACALRDALGLSVVVVHSRRGAGASGADGSAHIAGPFVRHPAISTGAGDHFNAGCSFAGALGLPIGLRLAAGVGVSGWYVRKGAPPTLDELISFLRDMPLPECA